MSKKLVEAMQSTILSEGQTGKGRLADSIGRKIRIIELYLNGSATPSFENAYKLAKACGLEEPDALAIAKECAPHKSQRTA